MTDDSTIEVNKDYLAQLMEDSRVLNALYAAGVDNWDGYYLAFQECEDCGMDNAEENGHHSGCTFIRDEDYDG